MLLRDAHAADASAEPLLVAMSRPDGPPGRALAAFRTRRLYANMIGDFMVPFGTAAIGTVSRRSKIPWTCLDLPRCHGDGHWYRVTALEDSMARPVGTAAVGDLI